MDVQCMTQDAAAAPLNATQSEDAVVSAAQSRLEFERSLMDIIIRDDLEEFVRISNASEYFHKHMTLPTEMYYTVQLPPETPEAKPCTASISAFFTQDVRAAMELSPDSFIALNCMAVTTWNMLHHQTPVLPRRVPLLYYACCALSLRIIVHCIKILVLDLNMYNSQPYGPVCCMMAELSPVYRLSRLERFFRIMTLLLYSGAHPQSVIVHRPPMYSGPCYCMGQAYPLADDKDIRQAFLELYVVFYSRFLFSTAVGLSANAHPELDRCGLERVGEFPFQTSWFVQHKNGMNHGAIGMYKAFASAVACKCVESMRDCEKNELMLQPVPSPTRALPQGHLGDWLPSSYRADGYSITMGSHARKGTRRLFWARRKDALMYMWTRGMIWLITREMPELHEMSRSVGTHRFACHLLKFAGHCWGPTSSYAMLLSAQWLSIQRPNAELINARIAHGKEDEPKATQLYFPFHGFAYQTNRYIIARQHQPRDWIETMMRLWTVSRTVPEDSCPLALSLMQSLPLELLWYLMDSIWIEHIQCSCWYIQPGARVVRNQSLAVRLITRPI